MSTSSNAMDSRVQIKFNTGVDETGKPVYKIKSLGGIKSSASDEDVMTVAQALAEIQEYTVAAIFRIDQAELVNA